MRLIVPLPNTRVVYTQHASLPLIPGCDKGLCPCIALGGAMLRKVVLFLTCSLLLRCSTFLLADMHIVDQKELVLGLYPGC